MIPFQLSISSILPKTTHSHASKSLKRASPDLNFPVLNNQN